MLNEKMQDALNKQCNAEFFSSYLYLSMSAYFESQSLRGMAHWMRLQAQEELSHAMKFYDFVNERDGRVDLAQIEAPKTPWNSPLDVFEDSYSHERKITGQIDGLVELAIAEKDHATENFLQWFVGEQVEEEATVSTLVDQLRLVGENGVARFLLDGELRQRSPATTGE